MNLRRFLLNFFRTNEKITLRFDDTEDIIFVGTTDEFNKLYSNHYLLDYEVRYITASPALSITIWIRSNKE